MNILDTIIEHKKKEIAESKKKRTIADLERTIFYQKPVLSLSRFLLDPEKSGIIAEFKRKSPSKGIINDRVAAAAVTAGYSKYGASGLSVLTDNFFFGGSEQDLIAARVNEVPILRKDFMIDPYQVTEARAMGADAILLIAACLNPSEVKNLAIFAKGLQLEVLLEIHSESELEHICDEVDLVGVNNRDLKTFKVDIDLSVELADKIPAGKLKISESGISAVETIRLLRKSGYSGFLMGENFMKEDDPTIAFASFIHQLKSGTT